jgi:hypothetical protein
MAEWLRAVSGRVATVHQTRGHARTPPQAAPSNGDVAFQEHKDESACFFVILDGEARPRAASVSKEPESRRARAAD